MALSSDIRVVFPSKTMLRDDHRMSDLSGFKEFSLTLRIVEGLRRALLVNSVSTSPKYQMPYRRVPDSLGVPGSRSGRSDRSRSRAPIFLASAAVDAAAVQRRDCIEYRGNGYGCNVPPVASIPQNWNYCQYRDPNYPVRQLLGSLSYISC